MGLIQCGLKAARVYCKLHPGRCCASCTARGKCEKRCLNDPQRCGYADVGTRFHCPPPGRKG